MPKSPGIIVGGLADMLRLEGSILLPCGFCGEQTQMGRSGQKAIEDNPALVVMCMTCFFKAAAQCSEPVKLQPVPGAYQEIIQHQLRKHRN